MPSEQYRILVVSDVHGRVARMRWVLKNEPADALFFLGDGLYDLEQAIAANGAAPAYPIYRVCGNCDVGYPDPAEGLAPFGGVLFFYTHGHHYGVKSGHTHYKALRAATEFSPALFNPGSLRDGGSYGVITVTDGNCSFGWKQVPQTW